MSTFEKEYQEKLVSAEKAAEIVKSGDFVDYGWCVTTTVAFDKALAKRMPELTDINLRGGILLWEPEVFKIENPEKHFTWNSWHSSGLERKLISKGLGFYMPLRYSEMPRYYRDGGAKVDVAVMQVTPMDEAGYFNFSVSPSHMMAVCEVAKKVIVEVNKNLPVCQGGFEHAIHISKVDMIIEGDNPMPAILPAPTPSEVDMKVAELIVEELKDGCCIQLGIGAMPTAVGSLIAKSNLKGKRLNIKHKKSGKDSASFRSPTGFCPAQRPGFGDMEAGCYLRERSSLSYRGREWQRKEYFL